MEDVMNSEAYDKNLNERCSALIATHWHKLGFDIDSMPSVFPCSMTSAFGHYART